ncbi:MAG: DNA primase [Candidatus Omnitrophica bacterium]|nr:DNA primase [Candidatus Omnitrophota bacterium]
MARDPQIQELLLRVDLVDLIGGYLKLTRSGRSFKGLCPFHAEKTPSFHVYPTDGAKPGFYHCFGCKKGGDALSFLVERDGLSFQEALEQLARRVGFELRHTSSEGRRKSQNRFELLNQCQSHFRANLRHSERGRAAREYLERRRVGSELSDRFGIGFATDAWEGLAQLLSSSRESLALAVDQGLVRKRDNAPGYYDFFRNRLMFPIHNAAGQIIAFAGRDLSGETGAKYINTPETDLFKKGRVLYGLHQARARIKENHRAILVEGYFDAIRMHAAGFEETVAPMGTAVTREHFEALERIADEVILLFDGDPAGRAAAARSLHQAWDLNVRTLVALLPPGVDPDEFLLAHPKEEMESILDLSQPAFAYFVDSVVEQHGTDSPEAVRKTIATVFESLSEVRSMSALEYRLRELAERLDISLEALRQDWTQFARSRTKRKVGNVPTEGPIGAVSAGEGAVADSRLREARRGLHTLLLQDEGKMEEKSGVNLGSHPRARERLKEMLEILPQDAEDGLALFLKAYLEEGQPSARRVWDERGADELVWEVEAILREERIPENPLRTLEDYADTLRVAHLDAQIRRHTVELRAAERSSRWDDVGRLASRLDELVKEKKSILSKCREVR